MSPGNLQGFPSALRRAHAQGVPVGQSPKDIEIYTVAFNVSDDAIQQLLQEYVSKPPYAYNASTATELVDASRSICKTLSHLRFSK